MLDNVKIFVSEKFEQAKNLGLVRWVEIGAGAAVMIGTLLIRAACATEELRAEDIIRKSEDNDILETEAAIESSEDIQE